MSKKVAFITGASTGIGHASAKLLQQNGFKVYATARRVELMKDLEALGATAMHCDVTDSAEVQKTVDAIIEAEGQIDVVFANAGYCLLGPVELQSVEAVQHQYDVNVFGMHRTLQAALPHLRKRGQGRVIITSSSAGHISMPNLGWYSSTKYAQQATGDSLRGEVKPFGIHVSLIEPGYIDTDIDNASLPTLDAAENHPQSNDEYKRQIRNFRKRWSTGIDKGASANVIAAEVLKAATAAKPKRRYAAPTDAKLAKFMRRFVPAAMLDRVLYGVSIAD
ncbi:SDR family NAD(P)-dependent oxidoreductase [Oricola sp.]|uniref:SDR family NAD(P)-dependent oxidoreductase n=1 Tax=Oricola sp. TaxID=1979950 RepID=UPI003BAC15C5